jgi:hypothetical protein
LGDTFGAMTIQSELTEAKVLELRAKYAGRTLLTLRSAVGTAVALAPNLQQAIQYESVRDDAANAHNAHETLVRGCIVHPPKDELDALLLRRPALVEAWLKPLKRAAGADDKLVSVPYTPPDAEAKWPGRELVQITSTSPAGEVSAVVAARVPNLGEMREFRRRVRDHKLSAEAESWLVRSCLIEPATAGELNILLDRVPLLLPRWSTELCNLAGGAEEVEVGKL